MDEGYYKGDDYVDYEAQSAADHLLVARLLKEHHAEAPVLEVGCATGGLLAALDAIGLPSIGLDISAWAVAKVAQRLGSDRAWQCDVENDELPHEVLKQRPFGALVLWAVLEHFSNPSIVLERLTRLARKGTRLLINTSNADSLTHFLFRDQWEGYFDWTHLGVRQVSVLRLRQWLKEFGWRVECLNTELIWDGNADPTRATLRDWWVADARFRRLIFERDLGDLIRCVAVKE